MPEKAPRSPRYRKRISVRFGSSKELTGRGFTLNISAQGMAIATHSMPKLGARIFLELGVGPKGTCRAEGNIAWAQRGLGQAGTYGVKLIRADEEYFHFVLQNAPPERARTPASLPAFADLAPVVKARPENPVETKPVIRSVIVVPPTAKGPVPAPEAAAKPIIIEQPEPPQGAPAEEVLNELPDFLRMLSDDAARTGEHSAAAQTVAEILASPDWWMPPEEELGEDPGPNDASSLVEREPRIPARFSIQFGVGVALDQEGTTVNLSSTGLAVAVPTPAEPGELVVFAIKGNDGLSRGAGQVVWVREVATNPPETCIGLRLIQGDSRYRLLLESLAQGS